MLDDPLAPAPGAHFHRHLRGVGRLEPGERGTRLVVGGASDGAYSDAQLDDYCGRRRDEFPWRPPLTLELAARFSRPAADWRGTAGFGWWNDPFAGDRATEVAVGPRAIWFFLASAPSMLATTPGWSGRGFFAQLIDSPELPGWLVRLGMLAMRLPVVARLARRGAATVGRAGERALEGVAVGRWHRYRIDWLEDEARFWVDGRMVMSAPRPPAGPLGLVLWVDNQWATVSGEGGLLEISDELWLELSDLRVLVPTES